MENQRIRRKDGFGILETVVVLAMMLVMLTALVPMLIQSISALQLAADAQNIASELQLAKFRAVAQSTPYQVTFSTTIANSTLQRYDTTSSTFQSEGSPMALGPSTAFVTTPGSVPSGGAGLHVHEHPIPYARRTYGQHGNPDGK